MLQLYDLCRLCAQKKRNKVDLFNGHNDEEDKILLAKISLCLSLQVTREDMLPKMICIDCQKMLEQFNAFRIKCQKAEDRLNKMLALVVPNKLVVPNIKQEYSESDFHENTNLQMKLDSPKCTESNSYTNLKTVKNVKCEVDEPDIDVQWNPSNESTTSDLIQIISEEIVNQQYFDDVKQPQIEIISENYNDEYKNVGNIEIERKEFCDIKVIPEVIFRIDEGEVNSHCLDVNYENQMPELNFVEIKKPANESEEEIVTSEYTVPKRKQLIAEQNILQSTNLTSAEKEHDKSSLNEMVFNEGEIDEKYLTLQEGETCDVDIEEMDALIKKKQDPNAVFKCDRCYRSFKFFKCFRKHKHWHDSQPDVFICDYCKNAKIKNFEFSTLKSLNNHIQRKHLSSGANKFQCNRCHQILTSQGQLNAHFRKVHDDSGASCQECGKKFKNKARLNGHLKVHQEERPYVCDQCGQTFKWSNALKVHIQWHKQEKNFLCSECGKKFTAKKNLIEHLNIHTGKRPYICEHCNASFVQFSAYSKHLYLHNEGKRIHKCDKCDKCYSHAYMLKQHMIRHSGLRPYECSTCHKTFKSQSDLCCHVKIHQEKQHGCHVCGKKFSMSKTLRDHMVRHTGIKHICPVPGCGKTYTQRFSLTKHFCKQHPSFNIVKKKGGKKAHLHDKNSDDDGDFIRYNFKEKEEEKNMFLG